MSHTAADVVVLGAGLCGMSAAWHLRQSGASCRVIERASEPGGLATTTEERGYRFDRTGHLLHLRDPSIRTLVEAWTPGGLLEIERNSVIWSHGVFTRYPFQANTFGLPPQVAYECVQGFVEAYYREPKPTPKNFEEYCLAHFGPGMSRHFMIPYNTRLWGVPPHEISTSWCERFVPKPTVEDVLAGAVGLSDRKLGYNARFLYPRLGIGQLSRGLAEAVGDIELGRAPRAIRLRDRKVVMDDEEVSFDSLVSSIPLPSLVSSIEDAPTEVKKAAGRLRCTHLYYLDVALQTRSELPYHWVYVPEARYPFYRVGCYSNFSSAMAPPNGAGLYVELADRTEPDLATLLPDVADGLQEMGFIRSREAVRFARVRRIDHAYVIFDDAYDEAVALIHPFLEEHGIHACGRYGGWTYSSMEDALCSGRDAARAVAGSSAAAVVAEAKAELASQEKGD